MPNYGHVRHADGTSAMRRLDKPVQKTLELNEAPEVDLPGSSSLTVHRCVACDKPKDFKLAAHVAKHFRSEHQDLNENDDSWRDYYEKHVIQR